MHSQHYLQASDFAGRTPEGDVPPTGLFGDWSDRARVAIVAPDPANDLLRAAGTVLLWTYRFYQRLQERDTEFDYPSHYVIGGQTDAEPALLGPDASAKWSAAWCRIDVWPSIRHAVAHPDAPSMLAAALALEPTHLLWPARWPWPCEAEIAFAPGDAVARSLLLARLEQVLVYGDAASAQPGAWCLSWSGGAARLTREAHARLPAGTPEPDFEEWLAPVPPAAFLGRA